MFALNFQVIVAFLAIVTTALSAGIFYAWSVTVIPGLKRVSDHNYLETMQSVNRAILNPLFFIAFIGCMVLLALNAYFLYQLDSSSSFIFTFSAFIIYIIGTFGVTVFGNVPMNESLDKIDLKGLNIEEVKKLRSSYEGKWNTFNYIRTFFAVTSFCFVLISIMTL